jgi:polar amino acid transport system permease protein
MPDPMLEMARNYGPLMLAGLSTTAWICFASSILGLIVGMALALCDVQRPAGVRWIARSYIEIMRGLPILILLFLLYYGGPSFGLRLRAETAGIIGLGAYSGAYFAEIFRSGFRSIPCGQIEAARMTGLSRAQIVTHIELPQMLVLITPPIVNQVIIVVKESAVLSIITVAELTKNTTQFVNETYTVITPYLAAALLYWLLVEAIAWSGRLVERRIRF